VLACHFAGQHIIQVLETLWLFILDISLCTGLIFDMEAFALRYLANGCRKCILLTLLGVLQ
jgi:hypothetical protein